MKLKLAAAIFAASLPLASMAFGQGTAPANVAVIDACPKTAEETGGFGGASVGLVAAPLHQSDRGRE
ncbi:hypothetical protein AB8B21_07265 [Tardiphaga sp. 866_E4_N2_1]|uniref:hypothetical protein n=1 Tax=unclassified Tardiphaga TaxID=2631404 RepID=UPI003F23E137